MAFKTIKLTEDHIRLIKSMKFEGFSMGENIPMNNVVDAIKLFYSDANLIAQFPSLLDELLQIKDKLETLSIDRERLAYGIDTWSLFGGSYAMEDIAIAIGRFGDYIRGTEEDPLGRQFPKELEDYMWGLYHDISDNLEYIISLVLFYVDKGGLTPGTYRCKINEKIWEKIDK